MQLASSGAASCSEDWFCHQNIPVLWMRGDLAFTPIPFSAFVPHLGASLVVPATLQQPPAPAQVLGDSLLRGASLFLFLALCFLTGSWILSSLFLLVQATRSSGRWPCTKLCPISCFLLSMTVLWKQIPFLKWLLIFGAFVSSAFTFRKVSGAACVSVKSSSRSSDP